ncbi:hypothetical protein HZR84_01970 [Hyphobacterium sp. CCMP332]|nr:hypothetical protein HZR84_01970 [Hyphobacterium sp. CCMP332]
MKQIASLLVLSVVLGYMFPWWIIGLVAFACAYAFESNALKSFLISFLTVFLYWGGLAFYIDMQNDSILSNRMSNMILSSDGSFLMILITALIGGLVAGLFGLSGTLLKKARG